MKQKINGFANGCGGNATHPERVRAFWVEGAARQSPRQAKRYWGVNEEIAEEKELMERKEGETWTLLEISGVTGKI